MALPLSNWTRAGENYCKDYKAKNSTNIDVSPKDVVFESKNDKVEALLKAEINKLQAANRPISANDEVIAFINAGTHAMKYTSGREVIKVRRWMWPWTQGLISVTRVTDDDRQFTRVSRSEGCTRQGEEHWHTDVRGHSQVDWLPSECWYETLTSDTLVWPITAEFRGFVCKQKFNALSQYFHFCYWPELVQQKEEIARRVTEFWETRVKHRVKHTSYTIDFAVLQDRIYVIEINPFVRSLSVQLSYNMTLTCATSTSAQGLHCSAGPLARLNAKQLCTGHLKCVCLNNQIPRPKSTTWYIFVITHYCVLILSRYLIMRNCWTNCLVVIKTRRVKKKNETNDVL